MIHVVGGGITGLTLGHLLKNAGVPVTVYDDAPTPGGMMTTLRRDGYLLERGPFNVIVRSPEMANLLADLHLEPVKIDRAAGRKRYVLWNGQLRPIPWRLLGLHGSLRMLAGMAWSRRGNPADTLHDAAIRRLGRTFADRAMAAMSVGIFGAAAGEVGLAEVFPKLAEQDRRVRSPLLAMAKRSWSVESPKRERGNTSTPNDAADSDGRGASSSADASVSREKPRGMISFAEGLGELTACLAESLGHAYRRERIDAIDRFGGDAVILTTGPTATAGLLQQPAPPEDLASLVVVHLAFDRLQIDHALDGFGYLAPPSQRHPILGCIFASTVFPHHAPPGKVLLRAMLGGTIDPQAIELSDAKLVDRALLGLRGTLRVSGEPELIDIVRWPSALAVYRPGRAAWFTPPVNVTLAGNFVGGVSVNDRVVLAHRVAAGFVSS